MSDISQGQADEYVSQLEELIQKYNETFDAFMAEIKGRVDSLNKQITDLTGQAKTLQDKLDALKEEISKLGNLQTMYSNSIDFGNYDYSGNPNLMANINADSFSQGAGALSVIDDGDEVVVTLDPNHKLDLYKVKSQPALVVGETYNMSVEIMLEDDFTGDPSTIALGYFKMPNWVPALTTPNTLTTAKGVWQKLTVTAKMTATINNAKSWYITLYNQDANNSLSGRLRLRHAKLEVGSTATPYQPNLLDAPYYLSKVPLGENIANKSVTFPIKTSAYAVYSYNNTENFIVGEKYVLTIKARKSATQTFNVRNVSNVFGDMKPVEGLTDIWVLEFTPTSIDKTYPAMLDIYQIPSNNVDACQIEWLKIEKGDTRTPNISQFKYFGEGLKDSNNLNDYSWDITPEYTEKRLNDSVSLTEPQSIDGTKNFLETPMVNGEKLLTDTVIPFEAWYVQAAEIRPASNGSKLPVGRELTTIGKKNRRSMKSNPLNWSSDQLSAEVVRDCTLLIDGTVILEFGGTSGSWAYVEIWNGIDIIGEGYGAGISQQYKLWYRNGIPFSRYITLKAGTQLSIGVSMLEGTSLTKAVMSHFHVMEIDE